MTIRRDLEKFERDGLLERCHGGAVINSEFVNEAEYPEKSEKNVDAKRKIAEYAASFVKEGMSFSEAYKHLFKSSVLNK